MKITKLKYTFILAFGIFTVTSIQAQVTPQILKNYDEYSKTKEFKKQFHDMSWQNYRVTSAADFDTMKFTKEQIESIKKQDSLRKQQGFIIQKQPPSQGGQSRSLNNIPSTKIKTINTNNVISNPNNRKNVIDSTKSGG